MNAIDAGAIDAFLIGSEFRALCSVRDSATNFPAVARLKTLASDVKGILGGGVKVSYAADWSDYNGYRPADGSNEANQPGIGRCRPRTLAGRHRLWNDPR